MTSLVTTGFKADTIFLLNKFSFDFSNVKFLFDLIFQKPLLLDDVRNNTISTTLKEQMFIASNELLKDTAYLLIKWQNDYGIATNVIHHDGRYYSPHLRFNKH